MANFPLLKGSTRLLQLDLVFMLVFLNVLISVKCINDLKIILF